jgi:hypothetical protein
MAGWCAPTRTGDGPRVQTVRANMACDPPDTAGVPERDLRLYVSARAPVMSELNRHGLPLGFLGCEENLRTKRKK